jgi:hypothetical protein
VENKMIEKKEILLSRKEVAEKFKVIYPTLKQWRDRNILPACKTQNAPKRTKTF